MTKTNIINKLNSIALEKPTLYSGFFGYDGYNIKEYKNFHYIINDLDDVKIMLNVLLNIIFKYLNTSNKLIFRNVEYNPTDYMLNNCYDLSNLNNFYDLLDVINNCTFENNILTVKLPIYSYK